MTRFKDKLLSWPLFAAALLAAATGCGGSKGLVPVEGRVTFSGEQPPASGYLYFVPREMSVNQLQDRIGSRPGTAIFLQDGTFRAGTFTPDDGLRPGTYEVRLECSVATSDDHDGGGRSLVPRDFTPPDLVVPSTGSRPVRYDVDVRQGEERKSRCRSDRPRRSWLAVEPGACRFQPVAGVVR